jgi:hypothetical protein
MHTTEVYSSAIHDKPITYSTINSIPLPAGYKKYNLKVVSLVKGPEEEG